MEPNKLLTVLEALEEMGEKDSYMWSRVVNQLPAHLQPPPQLSGSISVNLSSPDFDIEEVEDEDWDELVAKVDEFIKMAWKPLEVRITAGVIRIEHTGGWEND
jgi:hypothetical protein